MFHRLVVPTYFGGLPGGFDLLNDPSTTGGSGVAAPVDSGTKTGGVNDGVYFAAFGEDATSAFQNRGHNALGQNTDFIDDLLRRDIARPKETAIQTASGSVSSFQIVDTDDSFVGVSGTTNNAENRRRLFRVIDTSGHELLINTGGGVMARVEVTLVHNGSGSNQIGVPASGFFNDPTLNFSPSIPDTTQYRVVYLARSNLATHPVDQMLVGTFFGGAVRTDGDLEVAVKQLQASGLNERYRRGSGAYPSLPFTLNSVGDGATVSRDGKAVTSQVLDGELADYTNGYSDEYLANFLSRVANNPISTSGSDVGDGGTGFVSVMQKKQNLDSNDKINTNPPLAGYLAVIERNIAVNTLAGIATRTRVDPTASGGSLNPDAGTSTDARRTIQLAAADFFYNNATTPAGQSEVARGYDMIKVIYVGGLSSRKSETYVITSVDGTDPRRCMVRTLSGGVPGFPSGVATTDVRFQFLKLNTINSTGFPRFRNTLASPVADPVFHDGFIHVTPPLLIDSSGSLASELLPLAPIYAAAGFVASEYGGNVPIAMFWGGHNPTQRRIDLLGALRGDGSIVTSGRSTVSLYGKTTQAMSVSSTGSQQWNVAATSRLTINVTVDALTLTLTLGTYTPTEGDQIEVVVNLGAGVSTFTLLWPTSTGFVFSSSGDKTPSQGANSKTRYTGAYTALGSNTGFAITKTSYPSGGVAGP
jgi:hypothetical protein